MQSADLKGVTNQLKLPSSEAANEVVELEAFQRSSLEAVSNRIAPEKRDVRITISRNLELKMVPMPVFLIQHVQYQDESDKLGR